MSRAEMAISIVVPVYRHWHYVPDLCAALDRNDLRRHGAELVLVDDEPSAPRQIRLPDWAKVVSGPGHGSYAARISGAAAARGGLLVFTDADCRPWAGWLEAFAAAAASRPGTLLAGPVRVRGSQTPNRYEIYDIVRGIPQARYVAHGYAATANLAVPAEVLRAVGGFQGAVRSGGDAEFCRRARRHGYRLHYVPEAGVDHVARDSWSELVRKTQRVKGGQVASGTLRHRGLWIVRTLVPPVREIVYYMLSEHPARFKWTAAEMRMRLWGKEVAETARLLAGGSPRR